MRKHGVPNYPDPTFRAGIAELGGGPAASINHDSPAFRDAARICRLPVPQHLGGAIQPPQQPVPRPLIAVTPLVFG